MNPSTDATEPLVEIKAGRLIRSGQQLVPDTRLGKIVVDLTEGKFLHFSWIDLKSGQTELDFVLFEGDAVYSHFKDRIYMLHFQSSSQRYFFWMQSPDSTQDESHLATIQRWISLSSLSLGEPLSTESETTTIYASKPFSGVDVELTEVVKPKHIESILPKILDELRAHLPPELGHDEGDIKNMMRSSTFKYALKSLTSALQSPHHAIITTLLGLPPSSEPSYTVLHFLNRIQEEMNKGKR